MKVCVYAIARNEEQFVDRWMASMQEADCVCVLDTGSADRTAGEQHFRGIWHLSQTILLHGENPQLIGGAKTVFGSAQQPIRGMTVSLKV